MRCISKNPRLSTIVDPHELREAVRGAEKRISQPLLSSLVECPGAAQVGGVVTKKEAAAWRLRWCDAGAVRKEGLAHDMKDVAKVLPTCAAIGGSMAECVAQLCAETRGQWCKHQRGGKKGRRWALMPER